MSQDEYNFCVLYVNAFLSIIEYANEDNSFNLIEKYRNEALFKVNQVYGNTPFHDKFLKNINDDYDRQVFDFIKENVADDDPEFFNERINYLKALLAKNKDYALRLGMTMPALKIDDYYSNYLIALKRTLQVDFYGNIKK